MNSITTNRVNLTITSADTTAINTAVGTIKTKLPMGGEFALTEDERNSLLSMNVDNRQFVSDVLVEMGISGNVLPAYITAPTLQNDTTLYDQLDAVESRLSNVLQIVRDLKRMAAHEAFATALAVYKMYELAAAGGVPGAQESFDRLKARFEGQGGSQSTMEA